DFGGTDFTAMAKAMGGNGVTVRDREGLAKAVKEGLAAENFTIISAVIGRQAYDGRL
ncbi:MAG: thiamine pyrophosphate-binding protein, partial [Proteobacteria bacterium]|nr:thiamine pyrophosphate-binding protein [Pseudomonadota bacterium]